MATSPHHRRDEINAARALRRQLPMIQLFFAGVAVLGALGMVALYDAARPDATHTAPNGRAAGQRPVVDEVIRMSRGKRMICRFSTTR
jgi:hypothetical protein